MFQEIAGSSQFPQILSHFTLPEFSLNLCEVLFSFQLTLVIPPRYNFEVSDTQLLLIGTLSLEYENNYLPEKGVYLF